MGHDLRRALWSSGFRPFFLLGAAYGPVLVALWIAQRSGIRAGPADAWPPAVLHAHELIYGFASAIVCGVLLTALPSWSGAAELRGRPLALLAALWSAGRLAVWGAAGLPDWLVALADVALFPVLIVMLIPALGGARKRLFVWTLPPLVGLAMGNVLFHLGRALESADGQRWSLHLAVHSIAFLYSLYGGLLTPAFTRNYLRARGEPAAAIHVKVEYATAVAMAVFAFADLAAVPGPWMAAAAALTASIHVVRAARWRGWRTAGEPLLWTLHLGYAWFVLALILRGASALAPGLPADAWVHAFTVGALGLTMTGLMTRVVLRHTGRPLRVAGAMRVAYVLVFAAALLRLAAPAAGFSAWIVAASAVCWAAAFVTFLACHGRMLVAPSLPRPGGAQPAHPE